MAVISLVPDRDPVPTNDNWVRLADGESPAADGHVIVPFARLKGGDNQVFAAAAVGVEIGGADPVEELKPWLDRLGVVVLRFATFKDGRLFTAARLLRQRLGYRGDVRAAGDFLPDQTAFLLRSGVTSMEVGDRFPLDAAVRSARAYTVRYQPAVDPRPTAPALRSRGHE
jgi:uncharacterized protein (DUF934 family)